MFSCRGSWGCTPKVLHPLTFMSLSLDIVQDLPLGKRVAAVGVIFFGSIYLEIKVSNPTSGLPLGLLRVGEFLNRSGGRGGQRTGGKQHG